MYPPLCVRAGGESERALDSVCESGRLVCSFKSEVSFSSPPFKPTSGFFKPNFHFLYLELVFLNLVFTPLGFRVFVGRPRCSRPPLCVCKDADLRKQKYRFRARGSRTARPQRWPFRPPLTLSRLLCVASVGWEGECEGVGQIQLYSDLARY